MVNRLKKNHIEYGGVNISQQIKDINIRRSLIREIEKTKGNIDSLIRMLPEDMENVTVDSIKTFIMDLDLFQKDLDLSPSGAKYRMLDENPSAGMIKRHNLISFDDKLLKKAKNLTEATSILCDDVFEKKDINVDKEIKRMNMYLVKLKNQLLERDDILKGV